MTIQLEKKCYFLDVLIAAHRDNFFVITCRFDADNPMHKSDHVLEFENIFFRLDPSNQKNIERILSYFLD